MITPRRAPDGSAVAEAPYAGRTMRVVRSVPARRSRPPARRDPRGLRLLARRRTDRLEELQREPPVRNARRPARLRAPARAARSGWRSSVRRPLSVGADRLARRQRRRPRRFRPGVGASQRVAPLRLPCGPGSTSSASTRAASGRSAPVVCMTAGRARPRDGPRRNAAHGRRNARPRSPTPALSRRVASGRAERCSLPHDRGDRARPRSSARRARRPRADVHRLLLRDRARRDLREPLPAPRARARARRRRRPRGLDGRLVRLSEAQAVGVQHEYAAFLTWCSGHRSACAFAAHGDPGAAIDRLLARLARTPSRSKAPVAGAC